ncbi:hypothetical protein CEXT_743381 [Caerostris extrusa]|uniref:Uncharacterized protein n=1 Tax=Caerostris extrusa TaxID=172846 RepID=A0AAV4VWL6_CAEEX|nr:hypothetical protein CEXT_743381 [Caerostris extrusa]
MSLKFHRPHHFGKELNIAFYQETRINQFVLFPLRVCSSFICRCNRGKGFPEWRKHEHRGCSERNRITLGHTTAWRHECHVFNNNNADRNCLITGLALFVNESDVISSPLFKCAFGDRRTLI